MYHSKMSSPVSNVVHDFMDSVSWYDCSHIPCGLCRTESEIQK